MRNLGREVQEFIWVPTDVWICIMLGCLMSLLAVQIAHGVLTKEYPNYAEGHKIAAEDIGGISVDSFYWVQELGGFNMDKIFMEFEEWFLIRKTKWQQAGVIVDEAGLGPYGHQYWIKLHAENGLGNIILYESNGYYWVDFEAGNIAYDAMYLKGGIEFNSMSELDIYEKEFIDYILYQ